MKYTTISMKKKIETSKTSVAYPGDDVITAGVASPEVRKQWAFTTSLYIQCQDSLKTYKPTIVDGNIFCTHLQRLISYLSLSLPLIKCLLVYNSNLHEIVS